MGLLISVPRSIHRVTRKLYKIFRNIYDHTDGGIN